MGRARFDDTPVNGETRKGITSNWAYDHAADPDGHGNDLHPWTIFVSPFHTPKSNVNWNTVAIDTSCVNNTASYNTGAQNDEITWDVVLAAGTWSLELIHSTDSDRGIYSIFFDSVLKGTIDGYTGSKVYNVRTSVVGIVVPTTKKIELKLITATKNGSSAGYVAAISGLRLIRTT